jgi:hypothetical protein
MQQHILFLATEFGSEHEKHQQPCSWKDVGRDTMHAVACKQLYMCLKYKNDMDIYEFTDKICVGLSVAKL